MLLRYNYVVALPIVCVVFSILNVPGFGSDPCVHKICSFVSSYVITVNKWADSITLQGI